MIVRDHSTKRRKFLFSIGLFFLVLFIDQVTKRLALSNFLLGETRVIFLSAPLSFFFTLVMNKGAAWGIGSLFPYFLFAFRIIILTILFFLWRRIQKRSFYLSIALIIGGAVSNMIDCCFYGAVVDFIHFRFGTYDYPVFNVADMAICLGTVGCLLSHSFQPAKEKKD